MDAGRLNQWVIFKRRVVTGRDAKGSQLFEWQVVRPEINSGRVSAAAEPIRGLEYVQSNRVEGVVDVRFTVNYRTDIDSTMRVTWDGRDYEIVSPPIEPFGARQWLELMCKTAQT